MTARLPSFLRFLLVLSALVVAAPLLRAANLSGTVFEDVGYSGGAGRSLAASSGSIRSGARVEIYDNAGAFVSATTTNVSGAYTFAVTDNSAYTVRVVNSTVTSSLGGFSLIPVQTYRTTATSGSAVAVTDHVGGEDPTKADAGNGSTTLAALTAGSLTPQSIVAVTAGSSDIAGLDFGFNFATIVNVNDTGQGSLRQFIANANALTGTQTTVFMISDGASHAGLRAGLTNQLTGGVAVITPITTLPAFITSSAVVDGTSQTANVGNTNAGTLGTGGTVGVDALALSTVNRPEVEIVGSSSIAKGLEIQVSNSTIKGIAIHGFGASLTQSDISIGGVAGATITQNVVGTSATSFSAPAAATGGGGIYTDAATNTSITNNLVGFVGYTGIYLNSSSASGATIQNNEVRGCGTANASNSGIDPLGGNHTISGNLLIANKGQGLDLYATAGGTMSIVNNTVTGNGIGNAFTFENSGVRVNNSNNTLDRNRIYANYGAGVLVGSNATGNKLTQNSLYANGTITNAGGAAATGNIGIDLQASGNNNNLGTAPYYTINDTGDADSGGNNLLNFPILEHAVTSGGNLILSGWAPAGATLELFIADGASSGFGQGQTYLVTLTEGGGSDTDATSSTYSNPVNGLNQGTNTANRFLFSFAIPGGVTTGTKLTATARDASNNTSEFSGQVTVAPLTLSGTVYEDITYAGGSGRTKAASSGVGASGARVELFDASGNFLSATTTAAGGTYSFAVSPSTAYTVRAVNSTVTSSLGGSSLIPVQTYRTTAASGSAVAVTDRVGGEDPAKADAGNGSTTLAALTSGSLIPQSITAATVGVAPIAGLDFGFNFNTIVNTSDAGQGSLRQVIANANAMSGTQTTQFMIADGAAHAGLRAGLANQLTSGVAIVTLASSLPTISGTLILDATTQTTNVGNTNSGTLGTGGTVGVDGLTLSTVNCPEVEIVSAGIINVAINVSAANTTVKGLAIHGTGDTYTKSDIRVNGFAGVTITQCVLGTTASSFTLPAAPTLGSAIYLNSSTSTTISNNLIGFIGNPGVFILGAGLTGHVIQNNEIRGCGRANHGWGGLDLEGAHTISGNLIVANKGQGVDETASGNGSILVNNTVSGNGVGQNSAENSGIRIRGLNATIDRNVITANYGAGINIASAATAKITRNSIFANGTITDDGAHTATGQLGIDLQNPSDNASGGTLPYYTINDDGDADSGGNNLLNFPVLDAATIVGSTLELTGWAPTGATLEFFISDGDPSKFGEGQTYLGSVVEGGGSDTDATTSSYSASTNCFAQGAGTNVNRFKYIFALPGGLTAGTTKLTATATDAANRTSEFSGQVTIYTAFPSFTVTKSSQTYSDPFNGTTNPKAIPGSFTTYSAVASNIYPARSDTDSFILSDAIPANTELFVGDLGTAGSGPVSFTDGATSSTLTYTFTSLASTTDDLEFSNDGGVTWTYTPTPDSNGCDVAVTHLRIKPKGAFAKSACGNNPSFTLSFRVRMK